MKTDKLETFTLCVYSRMGIDLSRFLDSEYCERARRLVRHIIAARCDEEDILSESSPMHERRLVAALTEEVIRWHEDVAPLWEVDP